MLLRCRLDGGAAATFGKPSPAGPLRLCYHLPQVSSETDIAAAVNALVDDYRTRCLWSLRPDYYPVTVRERLRVLDTIERYGDLAAYRRASALRQWLSQTFSEASAGF